MPVKAATFKKKYRSWKKAFDTTLIDAGLKVETLTSAFHLNRKASSARGVYLNFLLLDDLILVPSFSGLEKENLEAKQKLEQLYKRKVIAVEADALSEEGGVINCVTWMRKGLTGERVNGLTEVERLRSLDV